MSRAPPSNCLFLPELPVDLTDATLERHFRGFVGFQVARTRHDRNGKLVGFVEFDAVDDAVRCRESMQGASPFEGISWHIHYSNNTKGTPKRPREEMEQPVGRMEAQRPMYDRPNNQQMMPPPPGAPMMQSPGGGYGGPHHGGPHGPHHGPHGGPPGPMYQPMGPGPGPMGPVPAGSSMPVSPPPRRRALLRRGMRPPPHRMPLSPSSSQPLLVLCAAQLHVTAASRRLEHAVRGGAAIRRHRARSRAHLPSLRRPCTRLTARPNASSRPSCCLTRPAGYHPWTPAGYHPWPPAA